MASTQVRAQDAIIHTNSGDDFFDFEQNYQFWTCTEADVVISLLDTILINPVNLDFVGS